MDFDELIGKADKVYRENFPMTTCFERAIFFSWACMLEECCKYCYMSTLPRQKRTKDRVRSFASLLAETIISKEMGWDYGFLSGGHGAFTNAKVLDLLKKTNEILGKKVWINIGELDQQSMKMFLPYIRGVIGTIEVLRPELHDEICPCKPIGPVRKMFRQARDLGLECGMTLILGLGESIEDFSLLEDFIRKEEISKIHVYGLNPQKGTEFENAEPPSASYQAEYIARIRIAFPRLDIQAGIWTDRVDRVPLLLRAGANSISKLPALRIFGTKKAEELEEQARKSGREFLGTLTRIPQLNWQKKVYSLSFEKELKSEIYQKLKAYLESMNRNSFKYKDS